LQIPHARYIFLTVILLSTAWLSIGMGEPRSTGQARLPETDAVYAVEGWTMGPSKVEDNSNHTVALTRGFTSASGAVATLTLFANQAPKLYGAGGEVPFLGDGYDVHTPTPELVPAADGVNALVAQRDTQTWLVMYAYGERRGLLGNGLLPWTLALVDGIAGAPNDYYKLYLMARADRLDANLGREVSALAGTLFPRIHAWYAAAA
jgi:hypothetical protein